MTEEATKNRVKTKRIAIVGSGISGQTCGYLLSQKHHVTLFEANDYLGGHTATIDTHIGGKQLAIDTGFIVFNDRTYPNFIKMMGQIGVQYKPTEMSFSVRNDINGLEYNGHSLGTLFSQRSNLLKIKFYRFIGEILRFNKLAKQFNTSSVTAGQRTLGSFLDEHDFSDYFSNNYILPMVAAIWSSSIESGRDCPLLFFIQFFNNHGLLDIANRPQWYVIEGGSRSYIPGLTRDIQQIKINTPVQAVKRNRDHVEIITEHESGVFDEVIFACHSDQALALLTDPSEAEARVLDGIQYRNNDVVLHTDTSLLPKRKKSHASWNYRINSSLKGLSSVTYNMNILQSLGIDTTLCVTLNQTDKIDPEKILRRFTYAHPVFSLESLMAQQKRADICGHNHTHYCGAYWYNGFHEDGVQSALDVCQRFGTNLDSAIQNQINSNSNISE